MRSTSPAQYLPSGTDDEQIGSGAPTGRTNGRSSFERVRPVDVADVDRDAVLEAGATDEALVDAGAVAQG
jgi:hypothetical protein